VKKSIYRIIVFIIIIVSILCISVFLFFKYTAIQVRIDNVMTGEMNSYIKIRGEVELEKKEKVFCKAPGIIKKVNVSLGQKVEAGTRLAEMDIKDYDLAYNKAKEDFNIAKLSQQDIINGVKQEDIKQAENQLEESKVLLNSTEIDLKYKEDKFKSIEELYENNSVSEQDYKDAKHLVDMAKNSFYDARQKVEIAKTNFAKVKNSVSSEAVNIAEAKVEIAKLQIDDATNKIKDTNIITSIDGTVISKNAEDGLYALLGSLLFEIGNHNSAYIKANVLSNDIGKIKEGQKVIISGGILDSEKIEGEVYFIAPKAEKSISSLGVEQQRIEVRIRFDNRIKEFKSGYVFDLEIIISQKKYANYIKDKAIVKQDNKNYVFIVQNGRANLVEVQIGLENDDYTEITKGISKNDVVIIEPPNDLKQGNRVSY